MAATVEVVTRLSGIDAVKTGLGSITTGLTGIGSAATSLGLALSIGITAPLVALGTLAAHAFIQQENALAGLNAALKVSKGAVGLTAQEIVKMASELQRASTFGGDAIIRMQTRLLSFKNISGETFKRASEAAVDLAARMGEDLTSAAFKLGRALEDPEVGLQMLRRAGIIFTDSQKLVIEGLVETGRLAEAQAMVLAEVEGRTKGAAAAYRDTLGGALQATRHNFSNLLEQIGEAGLGKLLRNMVEGGNKFVLSLQQLSPEVKLAGTLIGGALAGLGPLFIAVGLAVRFATAGFNAFVFLASGVVAAGRAIIAIVLALRTALISMIGIPGAIAVGLTALAVATYATFQSWDKIKDVISTVWSDIKVAFLQGIQDIIELMDTKLARMFGFGEAIDEVKGKIAGMVDAETQQRVITGATTLSEILTNVWDGTMAGLEGLGERVAQLFQKTFQVAGATVHQEVESVNRAVDQVGQKVEELTQKQKQLLKDTLDFDIAIGKRSFEEKATLVSKERELAVAGSSNELKLRREVASVQLEIFHREEELARKQFNNNEVLMQEWLENQKVRFEEMGEAGGVGVGESKSKTQGPWVS